MAVHVPVHQFEVRFVPIINFSSKIKDILAPYIQRTSNFQIEHENLASQKITLHFDEDSYSILITWDRMVFWSNIGLESLLKANSLIKEPFFSIYDKIKEVTSAGASKNFLFYAIAIKEVEKSTDEINLNYLKSNYLNESGCRKIVPAFNDLAITLDKKGTNSNTSLSFGPYNGVTDFTNRNVQISNKNISILSGVKGIFIEYKSLNEQGLIPDFNLYKNLIQEFNETVSKI